MILAPPSLFESLAGLYDTGRARPLQTLLTEHEITDLDVIADLIAGDAQLRLARGVTVDLAEYVSIETVRKEPELLDTAIEAVINARLAKGQPRDGIVAQLHREFPQLSDAISTAQALSSLLGSSTPSRQDRPALTLPHELGSLLSNGERRYQLVSQVGSGSQGTVYRAIDRQLSSPSHPAWVAVKQAHAGAGGAGHITSLRRFQDEARRARRVEHPNVVRVLDFGIDRGTQPFVVSELVEGATLETAMQDRATPPEAARIGEWMIQLAGAAQAVHAAGLVHRDIKPGNVLLHADGRVRLADLGLAIDRAESLSDEGVGGVYGTLAFIAPEQYHGKTEAITPASDVYALGALLYWLLASKSVHGQTPMEARAFLDAAEPQRTALLESRLEAIKDRSLRSVCRRCLATDPSRRYASADGLAADVAAWRANEVIAWTKPGLLARCRLWWRRAPGQVLAGTLTAASLVVAPAAVIGVQAQARQEILLTRATAAKEKLDQSETSVRQMQGLLGGSMKALQQSRDLSWRDGNLPSLQVLESLLGPFFAGQSGLDAILWNDRITFAAAMEQDAAKYGPVTIEALHWQTLRGCWLLQSHRFGEATHALESSVTGWERLSIKGDPWIIPVRALHAAAVVLETDALRQDARRQGTPLPDLAPQQERACADALLAGVRQDKPVRRAYYISRSALEALYGPTWRNDSKVLQEIPTPTPTPTPTVVPNDGGTRASTEGKPGN
ncbi:Serine/threonine-protein kinase PknL [Phycisphaerales bacterium]|nr:Serine/threonine-protein kinase PknL [Phycisphaerales bacterium]